MMNDLTNLEEYDDKIVKDELTNNELEIKCPVCNTTIGNLKGVFQGSCKCPICDKSFGFSNVKKNHIVYYLYN